jgi:F0F1-type ATP synthase membrane subunit b/b'
MNLIKKLHNVEQAKARLKEIKGQTPKETREELFADLEASLESVNLQLAKAIDAVRESGLSDKAKARLNNIGPRLDKATQAINTHLDDLNEGEEWKTA